MLVLLFCLLWDNNGDIYHGRWCLLCRGVSHVYRMYHSRRRYQVVMEKMIVIEIKIVMDQ